MLLLLVASAATARTARAARPNAEPAANATTIKVLSSRADLVTDNEALLEITVPTGEDPHAVTVLVGGQDESSAFAVQSEQSTRGLATGLLEGPNTVEAKLPDGTGAKLTLTDHPQGGPLFAGPQVQPWTCPAGALDSQCNRPATYAYKYKSTNPEKTKLQPYNPESPPEDVATVTVNGHTVPYIIRTETGYQDRDQYSISTLYNPSEPWSAVNPQAQFGHKMLVTHGASCNVAYESATAPSTNDEGATTTYALEHGWVVMSTAMDNNGHDCDVVTSAESLYMAKQRVIDQYGTLRYTIAIGCSGGSLTQQWVANAYPGIYQGLLPTCSFPDTWSSSNQVVDYHLLNSYFAHKEKWGAGIAWTTAQEAAVDGDPGTTNALLSDAGFFSAADPGHACPGTTAENRYNATTNIGGIRCNTADFSINVFGPRPESEWGPEEKELGHGFAGLAYNNEGVQYGLSALREGKITQAEFVDVNAKIGGVNSESIAVESARDSGNPLAMKRVYRSGMINETNNLGQVAIIDCRGPNPEQAHDAYRAFAVRARLERENGTAANQLIWEGPVALTASANCQPQALPAMDNWLSAVYGDERALSLPTKVIADKPSELGDRCYNAAGEVTAAHSLCGTSVVPLPGTPRMVAGESITTDDSQCRLQAIKRSSYPASFSDSEWEELKSTFPKGVCNYKKLGVFQKPTIPWLTYQTASGEVIYGGKPMKKEPVSKPFH
ncbi:MAG TPA: DUF6351 family protein [Solirubrobacteraceae bacterium]|nr:DUF6351 family protein [Solirubrobacteraceae bacterium]